MNAITEAVRDAIALVAFCAFEAARVAQGVLDLYRARRTATRSEPVEEPPKPLRVPVDERCNSRGGNA